VAPGSVRGRRHESSGAARDPRAPAAGRRGRASNGPLLVGLLAAGSASRRSRELASVDRRSPEGKEEKSCGEKKIGKGNGAVGRLWPAGSG
jgi:hypothetical protein